MAKILLPKPRFKLLNLGPLPHEDVGSVLRQPMPEGVVHCSVGAQIHAYKKHGEDFMVCHAYMSQVISAPDYIGRGPNQADGFEMILEAPNEGHGVLVAVLLRPSNDGIYGVKSCYPIDFASIDRRLRKNFLYPVK